MLFLGLLFWNVLFILWIGRGLDVFRDAAQLFFGMSFGAALVFAMPRQMWLWLRQWRMI